MPKNLIDLSEKIFLAGAKGMAGSAIYRSLLAHGYGQNRNGGKILNPSREQLNLLNLGFHFLTVNFLLLF